MKGTDDGKTDIIQKPFTKQRILPSESTGGLKKTYLYSMGKHLC